MASNFDHFLEKFPPIKPPQTLSEEDAKIFSAENSPLPDKLIQEFIIPLEADADEFTEFVPCFQLDDLKKFHAVIYWKAGLMNYQYIMVTFEKGGIPIDRRVLGGTFSDGRIISRSVARIDSDMSIFIMSGITDSMEEKFEAAESTTIEVEILPDGKMVELV